MPFLSRRTLLGAAAASVAAPALPAQAVVAPDRQRVLRFVPQSDLAVLDPIWTQAYVTRNHALMVFDTLYGLDDAYRPTPQMVQGHQVAQDGLQWDLTLRDGLLWHDGTPVLARDAVVSIRRWGARDSFGQTLLAVTDELSAPDDRTIRFRLKRPFPLLPDALGKAGSSICAIMPERLASTDPFKQVTEMVGSGPYRFVADERIAGARVVYARNERYLPRVDGTPSFTAGPKIAHFDRVEWVVIPDAATAAGALQSGEVDWWEAPTADLLPMLRSSGHVLTPTPDPVGYIGILRFNQLQPPFDNAALRRAVLAAVSQSDYMMAAIGDDPKSSRTGVGYFTPQSPMASTAGLEIFAEKPDLDRARQAVTDSGYHGEKVALLVPTDFPVLKALGDVGADLLKRIGLNVDYQASDWGTMLQRLAKMDPVDQGGWSAFHTFWSGLDMFNPAVNGSLRGNGKAAGRGWPTSPKLEEFRNSWLASADPAEQRRIAEAMQLQALQDVPYVPVGQMFAATAFRSDITDALRGFALFWNVRRTG